MPSFQAGKRFTSLVHLAGLREASHVNAITSGESRTLLQGLAARFDCFRETSGGVMNDGEPCVENRILRIVRAHAYGFLQVRTCQLGLAIECERPTKVAMRRSKVGIDGEGTMEF